MKTIQEKIAVMEAYADGKEIEAAKISLDEPVWFLVVEPSWNWGDFDYRVKPEPPKQTYVPYESAEEFLQAQKEHGPYLRDERDSSYYIPTYIDNEVVCIDMRDVKIKYLSDVYTWQDGMPVGKLKEE